MPLITSHTSPEFRFQELLREARNGSTNARWLVVQLFRKMMLTIANEEVDLAIHSREAPSDIVQETILEAQRDLDRFHGMTEAEMCAWLRKVLKRNIQNLHLKYKTHKRDLNREQRIDPRPGQEGPAIADPGPSASTILLRQERVKTIEQAISALPEHYQQVIILFYRKELSFQQMSMVIGRSEGATRQLWSRALLELSKQLKRQEQEGQQ